MTAPLLSASHICVRLGGAEVLHDVSLALAAGEIVTIVGPNGSGKSTLIRALLGIVPVAEGRIDRAPGLRVGYVPQRLMIDRSLPMTVRRFLSLPVRASDAQAAAVLARTGMAGTEGLQLTALSGGQMQRVLLARALLGARSRILGRAGSKITSRVSGARRSPARVVACSTRALRPLCWRLTVPLKLWVAASIVMATPLTVMERIPG